MTLKEYQIEAVKTAIYSTQYKVLYPALGVANESGEVVGKIKKILRDNDGNFFPEKVEEVGKEIGDVLWYLAALCRDLGLDLESIAEGNIAKLKSRQERGVIGGSGDSR